jgi:hypothetical protein
MLKLCVSPSRNFASAAGGDKARVFFGLNRQYSLRDRRIKQGAPQPRKVPFHRIGVNPPGTKYFCRDFKNPTTAVSNGTFTIEYRPFKDTESVVKAEKALRRLLPGCRVSRFALDEETAPFQVVRSNDNKVIFSRTDSSQLDLSDLTQIVHSAREFS